MIKKCREPVGDVRDRCRWQKKGALRTWLVLGYAEHCKFSFGKHCSGRKNQGKRKPADFFGHRNRKGALDGPQSATDNGFHAVTPHPSGFACHLLPLEKAYDVHRLSTDGTFAIIFKTALFFRLLLKATSSVAFPSGGCCRIATTCGSRRRRMRCIRDQPWNSAPTVGAGALDSPSKFGGICVAN